MKRGIAIAALALMGNFACVEVTRAQGSPAAPGGATQGAPAPSPENHPVDWAPRQYVELWNTGKTGNDLLNTIFNNITIMHTRGERIVLTPTMVSVVVADWRKSMPDLHFNIEDAIIQGNKVVLRLTFTGTYTKMLFPNTVNPADFNSPRRIHSSEMLIFAVKDGKIQELWEEYNEPLMRFAMGSRWCVADKPAAAKPGGARSPQQSATPPSKP